MRWSLESASSLADSLAYRRNEAEPTRFKRAAKASPLKLVKRRAEDLVTGLVAVADCLGRSAPARSLRFTACPFLKPAGALMRDDRACAGIRRWLAFFASISRLFALVTAPFCDRRLS